MQAAIWTAYGPPEVLQLREVPKPAPKADEVLVKIMAANVFPGDCELRRFQMHPLYWLPLRLGIGIFKPRIKILGQEFAGVIEAVGSKVTGFKPGDAVFSPTGIGGAYAEYVCLKPNHMARKPYNMSYEEAATVAVGGLNALHFLRGANIQPGHKVLLYGTAGCIGTWAVQLAKVLGAEVTAIDSANKLATLRELGADHVIDYQREDFTAQGVVYDAIVDIVGKSAYARSLRCIKPGGYFIHGNPPTSVLLRSLWARWTTGRRVRPMLTGYQAENLRYLVELIEAGQIRAVIDRHYTLAQIVDAHRYVESGEKVGTVVATVADSG